MTRGILAVLLCAFLLSSVCAAEDAFRNGERVESQDVAVDAPSLNEADSDPSQLAPSNMPRLAEKRGFPGFLKNKVKMAVKMIPGALKKVAAKLKKGAKKLLGKLKKLKPRDKKKKPRKLDPKFDYKSMPNSCPERCNARGKCLLDKKQLVVAGRVLIHPYKCHCSPDWSGTACQTRVDQFLRWFETNGTSIFPQCCNVCPSQWRDPQTYSDLPVYQNPYSISNCDPQYSIDSRPDPSRPPCWRPLSMEREFDENVTPSAPSGSAVAGVDQGQAAASAQTFLETESHANAEVEAESEAETEAESEAEAESETDMEAEAENELEAETEAEADTSADSELENVVLGASADESDEDAEVAGLLRRALGGKLDSQSHVSDEVLKQLTAVFADMNARPAGAFDASMGLKLSVPSSVMLELPNDIARQHESDEDEVAFLSAHPEAVDRILGEPSLLETGSKDAEDGSDDEGEDDEEGEEDEMPVFAETEASATVEEEGLPKWLKKGKALFKAIGKKLKAGAKKIGKAVKKGIKKIAKKVVKGFGGAKSVDDSAIKEIMAAREQRLKTAVAKMKHDAELEMRDKEELQKRLLSPTRECCIFCDFDFWTEANSRPPPPRTSARGRSYVMALERQRVRERFGQQAVMREMARREKLWELQQAAFRVLANAQSFIETAATSELANHLATEPLNAEEEEPINEDELTDEDIEHAETALVDLGMNTGGSPLARQYAHFAAVRTVQRLAARAKSRMDTSDHAALIELLEQQKSADAAYGPVDSFFKKVQKGALKIAAQIKKAHAKLKKMTKKAFKDLKKKAMKKKKKKAKKGKKKRSSPGSRPAGPCCHICPIPAEPPLGVPSSVQFKVAGTGAFLETEAETEVDAEEPRGLMRAMPTEAQQRWGPFLRRGRTKPIAQCCDYCPSQFYLRSVSQDEDPFWGKELKPAPIKPPAQANSPPVGAGSSSGGSE